MKKTNYSVACVFSKPKAWANAQFVAQSGRLTGVKCENWMNHKKILTYDEFLSINTRFCGGYSELS